jgi:hypothetical protein
MPKAKKSASSPSKSPMSAMDRNLALETVRVTEAAALAASRLMGRGDEKAADQAAVNAMRQSLNGLEIDGTVVIGEGERDEAPMLYIGEKVGGGGPAIDIALDPLEGTTITAKGGQNALAVIAMAEAGNFLNAPDTYMEKIAVGHGADREVDAAQEDDEGGAEAGQQERACLAENARHVAQREKSFRGKGEEQDEAEDHRDRQPQSAPERRRDPRSKWRLQPGTGHAATSSRSPASALSMRATSCCSLGLSSAGAAITALMAPLRMMAMLLDRPMSSSSSSVMRMMATFCAVSWRMSR